MKKNPARKTSAREKLQSISPSGKKDDNFFELVFQVVEKIPKGRVTTYGAIAACLGTKLSARTVGWALKAVPHSTRRVPAHRVVNSMGMLSGRHAFGGPDVMQKLLEKEKIKVVDDKVQDFKTIFWDPSTELN
jgi:methylated-DNA-protein-cysteine methyltransferase related protein